MDTVASGMTRQWCLDTYVPDSGWFVRPSHLHGVGHTLRVLVWTSALIDALDVTVNRAELLTAVMLHDTQRYTDGVDSGHGRRAAAWVLATFPRVAPDRAGGLDLELVADLCASHNTSDRDLPAVSLELAILKDADALNRARLGDLNPRRLRCSASHDLIAPAQALERVTRGAVNQMAAVRQAAIQMGRWPC